MILKHKLKLKSLGTFKFPVNARVDYLDGLKENVIVGHKIPAGTGLRRYDDILVGSKQSYDELMDASMPDQEMNTN